MEWLAELRRRAPALCVTEDSQGAVFAQVLDQARSPPPPFHSEPGPWEFSDQDAFGNMH